MLLEARHAAHATELRRLVATLPIEPGDHVLDVPCGPGFFTRCLAELVGPGGRVTAADVDHRILHHGRLERPVAGPEPAVSFLAADAAVLPFGDGTFDAAWCAHSLISLPDPVAALNEIRRVVRPGGAVGIVENDVFHDVLLPWPPDLELAVCRAERAAHANRARKPSELHAGRYLSSLIAEAGLSLDHRRTWAVDRSAPLNPADELFATLYLRDLWERVRNELPAVERRTLARLVDPGHPSFLPRQLHFFMTCLDVLVVAHGSRPG